MSAEREKFEAWWKKCTAICEQGPVPEEEGIAWAGWQARAEASPSVSGLPERPKRYSTETGVLQNQVPGRCNTWSETNECEDGDEIDAREFVAYADAVESIVDAQSSRIVELEKELAKAEREWKAYVAASRKLNESLGAMKQRSELDESKLAEMTADRDLWQGEHNEDCPNVAKLAVCREETIKECIAAIDAVGNIIHYVPQRSRSGIAQRRTSSVDFREALLSKLPTSVAAEANTRTSQ